MGEVVLREVEEDKEINLQRLDFHVFELVFLTTDTSRQEPRDVFSIATCVFSM